MSEILEEIVSDIPPPAPHLTTLTGKLTFRDWNREIKEVLKSEDRLCFVQNGEVTRPSQMDAWEKTDSMVKQKILASLSPKVRKFIVTRLVMKSNNLSEIHSMDLWRETQDFYRPESQHQLIVGYDDNPPDYESFPYILTEEIRKGKSAAHIERLLQWGDFKATDTITTYGDSVLHVVLQGSAQNNMQVFETLLATVLQMKINLPTLQNSHGSTLLHDAAALGNLMAVKILVEEDPSLVQIEDSDHKTALELSIINGHFEIATRLLEHISVRNSSSDMLHGERISELIVLAISKNDFVLASQIFDARGPVAHSDAVLLAIAQNFPEDPSCFWENRLLRFLVSPIVKDPSLNFKAAMNLLDRECNCICSLHPKMYPTFYKGPLFEATRRNSHRVVECIMKRFPNAVWCVNENGHNIIQQAVISRSAAIYNLLYMIPHYNAYRTGKDTDRNNLAHLAARLSPASKLKEIRGEALQIQYDRKWLDEVTQFVSPIIRSEHNLEGETPSDVFTKEHKELLKAGVDWLKVSSSSYITIAGLLFAVTFAAAIAVPGGLSQEKADYGLAVHRRLRLFKIYAGCIVASLISGTVSLTTFASVMNARFAEGDFSRELPVKVILGLTTLLFSLTTMSVAFGIAVCLLFGTEESKLYIGIGTGIVVFTFAAFQARLLKDLLCSICFSPFSRKRSAFSSMFMKIKSVAGVTVERMGKAFMKRKVSQWWSS